MSFHQTVHQLIVEVRPDRPDDDSSLIFLAKDMMQMLGVQQGGHLLLRGISFRQTVGIAMQVENIDKQKVRISSATRSSLKAWEGDRITACAFDGLPVGEHIRLAAFEDTLHGEEEDLQETYLAPHFHASNKPVSRGDCFVVRVGQRSVEFQVLAVSPGESVVVSQQTVIECDKLAIQRELENKYAPVSPRVPFSPMIAVTVRDLEGETLLDKVDFLRSTPIAEVKERVSAVAFARISAGEEPTRSRTFLAMGCKMKLIHQRHGLEDHENFESKVYEAAVELSVVLFVRTHAALTWGDTDSGGDSEKVKEGLKQNITTIFNTSRAFAALTASGGLVTWGDTTCGGDSSSVSDLLREHVIKVFSNPWAFAALRKGGGIVTWGDPSSGGDCQVVRKKLVSGVNAIVSTDGAFAAVKSSGEVVTWGQEDAGGNSTSVGMHLTCSVKKVFATDAAFAALKHSGEVYAWGNVDAGGHIGEELTDIAEVVSNRRAFAVRRKHGSVTSWGDPEFCCNLPVIDSSFGCVALYANRCAFAAVGNCGQVVTWGNALYGGSSIHFNEELSCGVARIYCNDGAFAAVKHAGSVVAWGDPLHGGDCSDPSLAARLVDIVSVKSNAWSFAAVSKTGAVVTWGEANSGGHSAPVQDQLLDSVVTVVSTERAFAALKSTGAVVTWGEGMFGGDSQAVVKSIGDGVINVCASDAAFAALKERGTVITWGDRDRGGDSNKIATELSGGVRELYSNGLAFVALKEVGTHRC